MRGFWQVTVLLYFTVIAVRGEAVATFRWDAPEVKVSIFSNQLGLMASEREDYATNLAILASNHVAEMKATPSAIAAARRMIGLALQLSPRNKRAVVTNFQLTKGIVPERVDGNYTRQSFAKLALTRGQLLENQAGVENKMLARYFIQLAAELDPTNEDAVYASEVQRLDQGPPDWAAVTNP